MENNKRVVVLISPDTSGTFFANELMKKTNVVGVFIEKQHRSPTIFEKIKISFSLLIRPKRLIKKIYSHKVFNFYSRKISKRIYLDSFGESCKDIIFKNKCVIVFTDGARQINNDLYYHKIKILKPDIIAVCGTSILKDRIIEIPPCGVLNLHTGLPQKYRGMSTTEWAIYNNEPEYIGSTVHYIDSGIDTGEIIYQGRPNISEDDNPASLNVKTVKIGTKMMIQAIEDIENNIVVSYRQKNFGYLYLERHFTHKILKSVWKKEKKEMIKNYLSNKVERDENVDRILLGNYNNK